MREGAVGDARFWVDAVLALCALAFLPLVAVLHRSRRRLALQTNQPPERGWLWMYLVVVGFMGIAVTAALSDLFDSLWTLWLVLLVVAWLFTISSVMMALKPWEGNMRQRPLPEAHRDDQAE
jgi:hypothetical protein